MKSTRLLDQTGGLNLRGFALPTTGAVLVCLAGTMPLSLVGALGQELTLDLNLSPVMLGSLSSGYMAALSLTIFWFGRLVDRRGWERSSRQAALAIGILVLVTPAAPSWWAMLLTLILAGAAAALGTVAAYVALATTPLRHRRGLLFGIQQATIPAALLLASVTVPFVVVPFGWRWAFVGAGLLAFFTLCLLPVGNRDQPRPRGPGIRPVQVAPLIVFAVGGACGGAVTAALVAFASSSAVENGMPTGDAGFLLALGSTLAILARIGTGALIDTAYAEPASILKLLMACGSLGFVFLALGPVGVWPGTMVAFGAGWGWAGLYALSIVQSHEAAPGSAAAVGQAGLTGGAAAGPILFGAMVASAGFQIAWVICAGVSVVGVTCIALAAPRLAGRPSGGVEGSRLC